MRQKFSRALGGVALLALVVGGATACRADDGGGTGGAADKVCDLKIGFFGALSGGDAGLVPPMKQAADLAVKQYNAEERRLQGRRSRRSTRRASRNTPAAWRPTRSTTPRSSASSARRSPASPRPPTRSSSRPACRPSRRRRPARACRPRAGRSSTAASATTSRRARPRPAYIKDTLKATKVFVVDDQSAYGAGLADDRQGGPRPRRSSASDKATDNQNEFGGIISKVKTSGATALFYGGYTEEASPFLKQLRASGWTGTFVGGDGINDANMLSVTGNADVEGTIATCPCAPATEAKGTFVAGLQGRVQRGAGCLRRRGVRPDEHLPGGDRRRQVAPGPTSRRSSPRTTRRARPPASPTSGTPRAS